jgi:single-strand DNA-binding protein
MAGSVNKVILVGGERKEKTQWHRIAIFNEKLGEIAERYLKKGSKVYLEGSLESRKFTDKDGMERETTEVVLARFRGELTLLDSRSGDSGGEGGYSRPPAAARQAAAPARSGGPSWEAPSSDLDDEIPF